MDVAAAVDDLAGHNADNFAVWVGGLDVLERLCIVGVAELRHEHRAVNGQEVEVTGLKGVLGRTRQHALDGIDCRSLLLGHVYRGRRHNYLVHFELAALGVGCLGKSLVGLLALLVELVVGIVGPHAANLTRRAKARNVVHMTVRLKRVDAVLDPNNLLDAQVLAEFCLDLLLGVLRIAVLVEQAHLSGHHGALAVAVKRATLEDVVLRTITVDLLELCHL